MMRNIYRVHCYLIFRWRTGRKTETGGHGGVAMATYALRPRLWGVHPGLTRPRKCPCDDAFRTRVITFGARSSFDVNSFRARPSAKWGRDCVTERAPPPKWDSSRPLKCDRHDPSPGLPRSAGSQTISFSLAGFQRRIPSDLWLKYAIGHFIRPFIVNYITMDTLASLADSWVKMVTRFQESREDVHACRSCLAEKHFDKLTICPRGK